MSDIKHALTALRRPKTLVRAARIGAGNYRRERDLTYALRRKAAGAMVETLIEVEERLEANRQQGESTYSIQRHVGVLAALIAEARLAGAGQAA
ncbi:DUF6477 family protein [Halovulum sp. GXIMD14793]